MTRKCENCNVTIIGKDPVCPLCGAIVGEDPTSPFAYPKYTVKHHVTKRIFFAITVAAIVIGLFVNAFTYKQASYPWVAVMAAGCFIAWLLGGSWMSPRMSMGAKILNTYIAAEFICILVDITVGWKGWSIEYVLTGCVHGFILTMMILELCGRKNYRRFFSYFIISLILSVIPPFLAVFGLYEYLWLALSPLLTAFVAFLTVFTVSPSRMHGELRKRFHL